MKNILLLLTVLTGGIASAQDNMLTEVASFGSHQPIGVTVSQQNRVFVSFPHNKEFLYALTEIRNGERVPYPNAEWNRYVPEDYGNHFYNVQDIYSENDNLWVLDSKPAGSASIIGNTSDKEGRFKLVQISLSDNQVKKIYYLKNLPKDKSALNDVRIDTGRQLAYFSDPGLKAIVILDLKTDTVRIVLKQDASTTIVPGYVLKIDAVEMKDDKGKPFTSDINSIALTKDNKYFYYKPINQDKLFRIETRYLSDSKLTDKQLSAKVEIVSNAGPTHGMIAGTNGNIYFGNSPEHAIKHITPDGKLHTLVTDERIIWPDSFGISPDGYLYFSAAQLNRLPKYNNGDDKTEYPYRIYKIRLPE